MTIIFTADVQRRVRLRNAKKFDLEPVLGEPLVVLIGELPQSHQGKLLESVELRAELMESMGSGNATPVSPHLARRLLAAQQELIGAALLDAQGDRLSPDDARTLLDLLPINEAAQALMQEMLAAVYERLGSKPKVERAADEPAVSLGK